MNQNTTTTTTTTTLIVENKNLHDTNRYLREKQRSTLRKRRLAPRYLPLSHCLQYVSPKKTKQNNHQHTHIYILLYTRCCCCCCLVCNINKQKSIPNVSQQFRRCQNLRIPSLPLSHIRTARALSSTLHKRNYKHNNNNNNKINVI
jgi:hypothetical protein